MLVNLFQFEDIKVINQDDGEEEEEEEEEEFEELDKDHESGGSLADRTCNLCKKVFAKPSQLARVKFTLLKQLNLRFCKQCDFSVHG